MELAALITLAILGAVLSLLSSWDAIHKKQKMTPRGKLVVALNIFIIVVAAAQYFFTQKEIETKENIAHARFDSSLNQVLSVNHQYYLEQTAAITEALGKYGYRWDSVSRELIKIVGDSSKVKVIMPESPVLRVCADGLRLQEKREFQYTFELRLCSYQASCTNIRIKTPSIIRDSLGHVFGDSISVTKLPADLVIPKDDGVVRVFSVRNPYHVRFENINILIEGTYMNQDKNKVFTINELVGLNLITNKSAFLIGITRDSIIHKMKEIGVYR